MLFTIHELLQCSLACINLHKMFGRRQHIQEKGFFFGFYWLLWVNATDLSNRPLVHLPTRPRAPASLPRSERRAAKLRAPHLPRPSSSPVRMRKVMVIVNAAGGLLVAVILRYADNVIKCVAVAISLVAATAISAFVDVFNFRPTIWFLLGAGVVVCASFSYTLNPELCFQHSNAGSTSKEERGK